MEDQLTPEDLRCPNCGEGEGHWLQENAKRFTWQPMQPELNEQGELVEGDYMSFDYGDDVVVEDWECSHCQQISWTSFDDLKKDLIAAKHARIDAAAILAAAVEDDVAVEDLISDGITVDDLAGDRDLGKKTKALAVLVCTPLIRSYLEQSDPKALEQARAALGLPVEVTA